MRGKAPPRARSGSRRIKRALDPHGIMNPSTILPDDLPELTIRSPLGAPMGEPTGVPIDLG